MRVLRPVEFEGCLRARGDSLRDSRLAADVAAVVDDVRARGDEALIEYAMRFDGVEMSREGLEAHAGEFDAAYSQVGEVAVETIRIAVERVREYSRRTMAGSTTLIPEASGMLGRIYRPVGCAGVYIPGGRKPYISTAIMTAVPAGVAGVSTVVACTPPRPDGAVDPHILVACREAGVGRLFKIGGAQAIAAMAYGTETVPKVDKVVGPGNRYVTTAKRLVYGDTGIDSLAGPSEIAILADESANPGWIAADLLAQAEHGPGSTAALFSTSAGLIREVGLSLAGVAGMTGFDGEALPRSGGDEPGPWVVGVLCDSLPQAVELINGMAPEHLQIMTVDPLETLPLVRAAGAILIGAYSPAALGDYVAGPSHVLPTGGAARFSSGLTADDFMVSSSLIWESRAGISATGEPAARLADLEGFEMHARALRARLAGAEARPGSGVGMG
ncbi:MAG: histidinol dehydrogenase [Ignavibacteriales bacterium]